MEDNSAVFNFYENQYNEDGRFNRHSLEFIRTKEIISRYLDDKKLKIADICGATGVYSYWLALQGHEVHLLDLSSKHIEQAKANRNYYNIDLASLTCADARRLPYSDNEFDMVLLMGALYHLQEQQDRLACIKEAFRVLKPNRVGVFSFISRYASLIDGMRFSLVNDSEFVTIYTVPNCQDKFFAIQSIFDKPCGIRKYCQCGWEDRATLASDPSAHAAAVRYEGRATAPFLYRQR